MKSYAERLAEAKAYSARPHKCNQPNQQFPRGARVKVADTMPACMSHFQKGFEGIVEYSFDQKYNGDPNKYSLIQLNDNGLPINSISWYPAELLTLLSDDTAEGKRIIEEYTYPDQP